MTVGSRNDDDHRGVPKSSGRRSEVEFYQLTLRTVLGSMMDKFRAKPGTVVGTAVFESGVPREFLLGPALLPSEIHVTRAKVDSSAE